MTYTYTTKMVSVLGLSLLLGLGGCGQTKTDRALSGAGLGAGAGAVGGMVSGGSPVTGAVLGGAAGAAAGALTDEEDINLGKPIWRR